MIQPTTLKGESVLLISPRFFNYEKVIIETILTHGGHVSYIDERPGNGFFTKGLIRLNANLLRIKINRYYYLKLSSLGLENIFTRVLIISPEAIDESILKDIKRRYPKAEMILYMWDSIRNKTGGKKELLFSYFDRILSFDKKDCEALPTIKFRPLFFSKEYSELSKRSTEAVYDLTFIGSIHSDRFAVCTSVKKIAEKWGLKTFFYLYLNDKKLFCFSKLFNPAMRSSKYSDFSFSPIPTETVIEKISESRCILDVQHPRQTGLTMRTIEVLGSKRKLLTTNSNVKNYDFYDPHNIECINRFSPEFSRDFVMKPYHDIDPLVYEKYSVNGWLSDVFGSY